MIFLRNNFFILKRILFSFLLSGMLAGPLLAQSENDSLAPVIIRPVQTDSVSPMNDPVPPPKGDSIVKKPPAPPAWSLQPGLSLSFREFTRQVMEHHPYFGFGAVLAGNSRAIPREARGKEGLFYMLVFLLLVFGTLRQVFPKYFNDLFRLFFRTTLKQSQISEQLMQTPLPSLLLNGFFIISAGLYVVFLVDHYNMNTLGNFWLLFLYAALALSVIYFIKFIGLKLTGWIFSMQEAAESYIFIVFIVNKMLGILLLPFLVLLAFATGMVYTVALTLSLSMVFFLLAYRFILSYAAIRNQVSVNPFHFFIYLCAVEVAPLLLIYKGLLVFFRITA